MPGNVIADPSVEGCPYEDAAGLVPVDLAEFAVLAAPPRRPSAGEHGQVSSGEKLAPQRGRPPIFDERMKGKVVGLVASGVSQRSAASYLGIDQSTISKAMERDADFALEVRKAQAAARIHPLLNVVAASQRNWRASMFLLRHLRREADLSDTEEARQREAAREQAAQETADGFRRTNEAMSQPASRDRQPAALPQSLAVSPPENEAGGPRDERPDGSQTLHSRAGGRRGEMNAPPPEAAGPAGGSLGEDENSR